MGKVYQWGINPIRDILFQALIANADIANKKNRTELYNIFTHIIGYAVHNPKDITYLDFEVKKSGICYKVIANNIITALWFSGILPNNPDLVMRDNEYINNDGKYTFNKKNKTLKYEQLK